MPTPTCIHIFDDHHRCGSPAMRGEQHCYFHHPNRKPVHNPYAHRARRGFDITVPETPRDLQLILSQILQRLAANRIDVHRASLLLYNLQLLAPHLNSEPWPAQFRSMPQG